MGNRSSTAATGPPVVGATTAAGVPGTVPSAPGNDLSQAGYHLSPDTANILSLIGREILSKATPDDLRNMSQPAVCKEYIILIADRLKDELKQTNFRVVSRDIPLDSDQTILYKTARHQKAICEGFAFFLLRILQLVYICLCHISSTNSAIFPAPPSGITSAAVALPDNSSTSLPKGGEKERKALTEEIISAGLITDPKTADNYARVLFANRSIDQKHLSAADKRIFLQSESQYNWWWDPKTNQFGFDDNKKSYLLPFTVLLWDQRNAPKKQGANVQAATVGLQLSPTANFTSESGKKLEKMQNIVLQPNGIIRYSEPASAAKAGSKQRPGNREQQIGYRAFFTDFAPQVESKGKNVTEQFSENGGVSATSQAQSVTSEWALPNPVFLYQSALLKSHPEVGGYIYEVDDKLLKDCIVNFSAWIQTFCNLLFTNTYTFVTNKDGKSVIVEDGRPKWGFKLATDTPELYERSRSVLAAALSKIPLKYSDTLVKKLNKDHGLQAMVVDPHNTDWHEYFGAYQRITALEKQMAGVMKAILLDGAGGSPPLVIHGTANFQINPKIIDLGIKNIEGIYTTLKTNLLNYYIQICAELATMGAILINRFPEIAQTHQRTQGAPRPGGRRTRRQRRQ